MKKICILFFGLALLLSACNNNKDKENTGTNNREKDDPRNKDDEEQDDNKNTARWSASEVRSFNKDCNKEMSGMIDEGKMDDFCSCLLDKFQAKFASFDEFNDESSDDDGRTAAEKCMKDLGIKKGSNDNDDDDTPSGGSWSSSDKKQWMDVCATDDLVDQLGKSKAKSYCECVLDKIQDTYSSFHKANTEGTEEEGEALGMKCIKELGFK